MSLVTESPAPLRNLEKYRAYFGPPNPVNSRSRNGESSRSSHTREGVAQHEDLILAHPKPASKPKATANPFNSQQGSKKSNSKPGVSNYSQLEDVRRKFETLATSSPDVSEESDAAPPPKVSSHDPISFDTQSRLPLVVPPASPQCHKAFEEEGSAG
jgi:hypothetical protein